MSHDITEVDAFTSPITVADGVDTHSTMANVVEAFVQALTNRTKHLKDHSAFFDAVSTWEQGQLVDIDQANAPWVRTLKHAGDHAGSAANIWKVQHEWLLTDGTYARLYSGRGGADGNYAITTNAEWHPGAGQQYWSKDDNGIESNVLRAFNGELHWYGKNAGAGTWTTSGWDTTRGVMRVGDEIHATGVVAGTNLFKYEGSVGFWVQLWPEGGYNTFLDRTRLTPGQVEVWRVRLPHGATIGQVNVKVEEYTNVNYHIILYRTHQKDYSDTTSPGTTTTPEDTVHINPGGTAVVVNHILNYGGLTVDNEFDTYWVWIHCDNTSPADLDVYSVQIGYNDPGPRNH